MAPHNKPVTLRDLESGGGGGTGMGGLIAMPAASNVQTSFSFNVGAWAVLMIIINIVPLPAWFLCAANAGLLLFNLNIVRSVGRANTPVWVLLIIVLQARRCVPASLLQRKHHIRLTVVGPPRAGCYYAAVRMVHCERSTLSTLPCAVAGAPSRSSRRRPGTPSPLSPEIRESHISPCGVCTHCCTYNL
jgi:hypothetical protein